MPDRLAAWARGLAARFEDIALVLRLEPARGPASPAEPIRVCLVMRDGAQVPWFAEGKGIEGLTWERVPGRGLEEAILADPQVSEAGLKLYMNFCDARGLMLTYDEGRERSAGDEVLDFRYRILYPDRDRIPPLEEFFYLWGEPLDR